MISDDSPLGGEFELLPEDFGACSGEPGLPDFGRRANVACSTGRDALRLALADWTARRGSGRIWLPDYLCPSVSVACTAAGCRVEFYRDAPDAAEAFIPPTGLAVNDALLFVHYFGIPNRRFLAWLPAGREWTLIEDCVQAAYSGSVGRHGDYAIASLRKWWMLPDGATLASDQPVDDTWLAEADEAFISMRVTAKLLRGQGYAADGFLPLIEQSEARLANALPRRMSWISSRLVGRCDVESMRTARRANWQRVADALSSPSLAVAGMRPLIGGLSAADVPLCFPVRIADGRRDALRAWLSARRIYCPIHWPLPLPLHPGVSPAAARLSSEALSLPIDQRYTDADMCRLISALEDFFAGQGR